MRIDNGMYNESGTVVFKRLYLQVFTGEIAGILFHNGQEKETLIRILSGACRLDFGRIYLCGRMMEGIALEREIKKNISIIHEYNILIPQFSIAENLFFEKLGFFCLNSNKYQAETRRLFNQFQILISTKKRVKELTSAESITICLLKAYLKKRKLVVLSNIISQLDFEERERIFRLTEKLKKKGMSFLVADSSEEMLFEKTESFCIIKNGGTIGMFQTCDVDKDSVSFLYKNTGNVESSNVSHHSYINTKDAVLVFEHVSGRHLKDLSFNLHRGEILRLFYTNESNCKELVSLLKRERLPITGGLYQEEKAAGHCEIGFIEENPTEVMLFKNMSVLDNLCIPLADKIPGFWMKQRYKNSAVKIIEGIIPNNCLSLPVKEVSGDIQQKIVYCKWLLFNPRILVCIKPFSTPDMEANHISEQMIGLLAKKGVGILIITPYYGASINAAIKI